MRAAWIVAILSLWMTLPFGETARGAAALQAGFAEADITPDVSGPKPVWVAGYGQNRKAEGVHDPLRVRAVVFKSGNDKIAMAAADVVGLQYPQVKQIREKLADFKYVMISSTHNHEGPDTMGIWGPSPFQSGIDPAYMDRLIDSFVSTIRQADQSAVPVKASYGTAGTQEDDKLLRDSRLPKVYDGIIRVVRCARADDGKLAGIIVQWNCHPETMGGDNKQITADFVGATVAALKKHYECPVAYFSGAVGGLMAPPRDTMKNAQGELLREGDFEFMQVYGDAVADLAVKAIDSAQPLELAPFAVAAKPITVPLANPMYQFARSSGVLKRDGYAWTGNFEEVGEIISPKNKDKTPAAETEVAYIRLGDLHIACIPGELYPELVYGNYQEPLEPNVDFPDAPLERPVMKILPGDKTLLIGLANDELGYIVPKRQWDNEAPFAYGRTDRQYGEENSVGPEVAPILMRALENRVQEAGSR